MPLLLQIVKQEVELPSPRPFEIVVQANPTGKPPETAIFIDFDRFVKSNVERIFGKSISNRIKELSALRRGWLDGEGEAFPPSAENWLLEHFATLPFYVRPGISPTPEGNISAEWSSGQWEASAEIDLRNHTVWWHALNVEDPSQEQDEEIQLVSEKDWQRLCQLANALPIS